MDPTTFALSLLGVVLGAVSLTWQAVQFRLTGSVVRVSGRWGLVGDGGAVTQAFDRFSPEQMGVVTSQMRGEFVLAVTARNVGRLAVTVTGAGAALPGGGSFHVPGYRYNPALPYRLDHGDVATFYVPMLQTVAAWEAMGGKLGEARMFVELATGEVKHTREGLPMARIAT